MSFTVYIIQSFTTDRYYVGQTKDLSKRLIEHNNGKSLSTRHGKPWHLIFHKTFPTRSLALQFESKIKKRGINRFLIDQDNG